MTNTASEKLARDLYKSKELSWKQIIEKIDDALSAAREEVLKEVRAIIDEEIENESTHDDERGHGQSLHLGAMEALQTLKERLKHDRY